MSEEKEIWKNINGYEELYKISNTGKVLGVKRNEILKPGTSNGYYQVHLSKKNSKVKHIRIHRLVAEHFLIDWDESLEVDHIDGDKTNNKISNLRMATKSENNMNRKMQKNNTTGFKGVSYSSSNKYRARIRKGKKSISKCFDSSIDAARWYNEQALLLFGKEFTRLNIIDE